MSQRLQAMLLGGLLVTNLSLAIFLTTLVMSELQPVQADAANQTAVTIEEEVTYRPLTDAPAQRNITQQLFVPLQ